MTKPITYVRVSDGSTEFDLPDGHPWITGGAVRPTGHAPSHVRRPPKPVVPLGGRKKAAEETSEKGASK